ERRLYEKTVAPAWEPQPRRSATRSIASCVPTQEHGRDRSRVCREGVPPAKAALYRLSLRGRAGPGEKLLRLPAGCRLPSPPTIFEASAFLGLEAHHEAFQLLLTFQHIAQAVGLGPLDQRPHEHSVHSLECPHVGVIALRAELRGQRLGAFPIGKARQLHRPTDGQVGGIQTLLRFWPFGWRRGCGLRDGWRRRDGLRRHLCLRL